jgi:hypothetical protein
MPPKFGWFRIAVSASSGATHVLYVSKFQSPTSSFVLSPALCSAGSRFVSAKYCRPDVFHCIDG